MNKAFCLAGMLASLLLCVIDFATSYIGIESVLPEATDSMILQVCPLIFATLALSTNALSSYLLRMFAVKEFTQFSRGFLTACFMGFLVYDGVSSWLGLLAQFTGQPIRTLSGMFAAMRSLDSGQVIVAGVIATLASFAPLLTSVFFDLWKESRGFSFPDAPTARRKA